MAVPNASEATVSTACTTRKPVGPPLGAKLRSSPQMLRRNVGQMIQLHTPKASRKPADRRERTTTPGNQTHLWVDGGPRRCAAPILSDPRASLRFVSRRRLRRLVAGFAPVGSLLLGSVLAALPASADPPGGPLPPDVAVGEGAPRLPSGLSS